MKKRPDIQGLRALAILIVVLFHAGLSFPGGFTGVDIFFVISGFVIAGTLLGELNRTGRIGVGGFYLRRARRILPAPAVMLVFVALIGILADPTGTQRIAAKTGIAASALGANFYLVSLPTGYFDVSTQLNPLLHTWMLSVIAQIYLVFPLLLLAGLWLGRLRRDRDRSRAFIWAIVALCSVLSFLLSFYLTRGYVSSGQAAHPKLAFYSSPTRFWEFGVGALLMLALPLLERIPARPAYLLGVAGAVVVGASAFFVHQIGFNEISALLPVAGACLLIAAGSKTQSGVSRLLCLAPVVWLGDISYSLYIWHWPLIVFAKALWPTQGAWLAALAAGFSLLPAWLSYRFVENPIRFRARSLATGRRVAVLASVCIASPIVANLGLLQAQQAFSSTKAMKSWNRTELIHLDLRRHCASGATLGSSGNANCIWRVPHSRGDVVLLGDSNAGNFPSPSSKPETRPATTSGSPPTPPARSWA